MELDPDAVVVVDGSATLTSSEEGEIQNVMSWATTNVWSLVSNVVGVDDVSPLAVALKQEYSVVQTKWYITPRKSLRLHCRLGYPQMAIYTMDIAVTTICAIEHVSSANTFKFQFNAKPKVTRFRDDTDKKGTLADSGTKSVLSFRIKGDDSAEKFFKSMRMLYQRSMQTETLQRLLRTRALGWGTTI